MIQFTFPVLLLMIAASNAADSSVVDSNIMESTSVKDAARALRIEIYDTFRLDRPEYNRRSELAAEASRRFDRVDEEKQQEILDWIVQSSGATRNRAALPPLPGGEFHPQEQLADGGAGVNVLDADEAITGGDAITSDADVITSDAIVANESAASTESDDELTYRDQPGDELHATSIVKTDKFGLQPKSRTFSILGSVGRAVTSAVAGGVGRGTPDGSNSPDESATMEDALNDAEVTEVNDEPLAEDAVEEVFDLSDDDLDLEELILDNPNSEDPLEPTPETFQRES